MAIPPVGPYMRRIRGPRPPEKMWLKLMETPMDRSKSRAKTSFKRFTGIVAHCCPQIVAGLHDPIDRFSYWVRRITQGGEVLAPGDGSDFVQFIDGRDVAQFARTVSEKALGGAYNLAGLRLTWADFMKRLGAENIVWVPAEVIRANGVTEFELPLYRKAGGPRSSLMHVSNERAIGAGLKLTALEVTATDVREWLAVNNMPPALSREREAALIDASHRATR